LAGEGFVLMSTNSQADCLVVCQFQVMQQHDEYDDDDDDDDVVVVVNGALSSHS